MNEEQRKPTLLSPLVAWVLVIVGAALAVQSARRGLIESLSIGVLLATFGLNHLGKNQLRKQGKDPLPQSGAVKNLRFLVVILAVVCLVLGFVTTIPHMTAACLFLLSVLNLIAVGESRMAMKRGEE